jgi:hypothetical protein
MTKLTTENILEDGEWIEKDALILDNRTKLVLLGHSREMVAIFLYSDQGLTFKFLARRWDDNLNPMDHWKVWLGFALQKHTLSNDQIQQISTNIKTALFNWPTRKAEVPIKEVEFLMAVS